MALKIFDRAGDSTGGVKEEKGSVVCLSKVHATARVDVPLCFVLLNSLMPALFLSLRRKNHIGT